MFKRPAVGRAFKRREKGPRKNGVIAWVILLALGAIIALLAYPLFPGAWQEWITTRQQEVRQVKSEVATSFEDTTLDGTGTSQSTERPIPLPSRDIDLLQGNFSDTTVPSTGASLSSLTASEQRSLRSDLLDLINKARVSNDLSPVRKGSNDAAQDHANDMLDQQYLSHWGLNGLKPYMRYTIAGGTDYLAENISGPAGTEEAQERPKIPSKSLVREAHFGLLNSPGHRSNILDRWQTHVNLGIACNDHSCAVVQHFERDYVDFGRKPTISSGILSLAGALAEDFELVQVDVWYDQPPHDLTLGQLDTTASYGIGQRPAAFVRPPPPTGSAYLENSAQYSWQRGVDPYSVSTNTPRVEQTGADSIRSLQQEATTSTVTVPLVTADVWDSGDGVFRVSADLRQVLDQLGSGVYTVIVWGDAGGEGVALTSYSIFVG